MTAAPFTDDQWRCLRVLEAAWPLYNLPCRGRWDTAIRWIPGQRTGLFVTLEPGVSLATFDWNELTSLVVAAHRERVRLSVEAKSNRLRLMLHARQAEGSGWEMHPGPEALAVPSEAKP
jgi:hypothetical protein